MVDIWDETFILILYFYDLTQSQPRRSVIAHDPMGVKRRDVSHAILYL